MHEITVYFSIYSYSGPVQWEMKMLFSIFDRAIVLSTWKQFNMMQPSVNEKPDTNYLNKVNGINKSFFECILPDQVLCCLKLQTGIWYIILF